MEQGRGYRKQIDTAKAVLDIAAAPRSWRATPGKVAVDRLLLGRHARLGRRQRTAAGGGGVLLRRQNARAVPKTPFCPTLLHFGEKDKSIPPSEIEALRAAFPAGEYQLYPAGHAFANEERPDHYDAPAASLARTRTDAFLTQHIRRRRSMRSPMERRRPVRVLLVNTGTPAAPSSGAVRSFLRRFLSDPRVIELPRALWLPLLYGAGAAAARAAQRSQIPPDLAERGLAAAALHLETARRRWSANCRHCAARSASNRRSCIRRPWSARPSRPCAMPACGV